MERSGKEEVIDLSKLNILVVGDAVMEGLCPKNPKNGLPEMRTLTKPFVSFMDSVEVIYQQLNENIDLLVIAPFLNEFLQMESWNKDDKSAKIVLCKTEVDYIKLINDVRYATNNWKRMFPKLEIIWILPYPPDFMRYNKTSIWSAGIQWRPSDDEILKGYHMASCFSHLVLEFMSLWERDLKDVNYFHLNECYFLKNRQMEESFYDATLQKNPSWPLRNTTDGLNPSSIFAKDFQFVFKLKVLAMKERLGLVTKKNEEKTVVPQNNYIANNGQVPGRSSQDQKLLGSINVKEENQATFSPRSISTPSNAPSHVPPVSQSLNQPSNAPTKLAVSENIFDCVKEALNIINAEKKKKENSINKLDVIQEQIKMNSISYSKSVDPISNKLKFESEDQKLQEGIKELMVRLYMGLWKDLYFGVAEKVVINVLICSIKKLIPLMPRNRVRIIMVTSDVELIKISEEKLASMVSRNEIGINGNMPFGAPIVLVDTPSSLSRRVKFANLTDLSCLIFYGDDLFLPRNATGIDNSLLVKSIYGSRKKDSICKIVITESKASRELYECAQICLDSNLKFIDELPKPKSGLIDTLTTEFGNESTCSSFLPKKAEPVEAMKNIEMSRPVIKDKKLSRLNDVPRTSRFTSLENSSSRYNRVSPKKMPNSEKDKNQHPLRLNYSITPSPPHRHRRNRSRSRSRSKSRISKYSRSPRRGERSDSREWRGSKFNEHKRSRSKERRRSRERSKRSRSKSPPKMTSSGIKPTSEYKGNEAFYKFMEILDPDLKDQYSSKEKALSYKHDEEYKVYFEVPDMHPDYEHHYELFTNRYRKVYGSNFNPKDIKETWDHYWSKLMEDLREKEWKRKQVELQEEFKTKSSLQMSSKDKAKLLFSFISLTGGVDEKPKGQEEKLSQVALTSVSSGVNFHVSEASTTFPPTFKVDQNLSMNRYQEKETNQVFATSSQGIQTSRPNLINVNLKYEKKQVQPSNEKILKQQNISKTDKKINSQMPLNHQKEKVNLPVINRPPASYKKAPPIKFNLSKPPPTIKTQELTEKLSSNQPDKFKNYSLAETLNLLDMACGEIGMMGPALKEVVKEAKEFGPSITSAMKLFVDADNELLVNIAINKLKTLIETNASVDRDRHHKTISYSQKLLKNSREVVKKGVEPVTTMATPPPLPVKVVTQPPPPKSSDIIAGIDMKAIARATVGKDTRATYQFIRNTFIYKGITEPSKADLDSVFNSVSIIQFKIASGEKI